MIAWTNLLIGNTRNGGRMGCLGFVTCEQASSSAMLSVDIDIASGTYALTSY
ncbi:hypothetical protein SAMN05518672_1075 [Chitinophaga sp. CF118]|nr:hypothetical protein SAMN05518672_1075 [Chitinophaga sp. CF118]